MPTYCCVPKCTQFGYLDGNGKSISFFNFPKEKTLRKKWIHAIRRDEGKEFKIVKSTKVCSLHFRESDLRKTLNGRIFVKDNTVPSRFEWHQESPKKRKAPTQRRSPSKAKRKNMALSSTMDEDVSLTDIIDVEFPSKDSQALHKLNEEDERGLEEELHRLSDETRRLKDEVKCLQDEVKRLSDENLSHKDEVIRLKIELEEHKKEKERLQKETLESKKALENENSDLKNTNDSLKQEKERLQKETLESKKVLENENSDLKNINDSLKQEKERLSKYVFSLDRFTSDEDMSFYTGFPNYGTFCALLDYLNPGLQGENIRYCNQSERDVPDDNYKSQEEEIENPNAKKGRPKKLKTDVEFFMVMCRLRRGFTIRHLAHLFAVAQSTISRSYTAWINFMYLKFSTINIWPSQEVVRQTMPHQFKEKFPSTRVIIDCTEVKCEMPSSLLLNSELFSSYKNHTTLKGLIGIAPNGAVTFASQLYTGSISDREIVIRSGLLSQQFNDGDSVMADKGFTIDDLLPLGTSLNIPPFLGQNAQMEPSDVIKTQQIASLRIHVERAINRVKNYRIWDRVIPLSQFGLVNQMWGICTFLSNTQDPLISE